MLQEYAMHLVTGRGMGKGVANICSKIRRLNREKGFDEPKVPRDVLVAGAKGGRKYKEVVPMMWEWVRRLWACGGGRERLVAVMVGVAVRLMLRPGEVHKITLGDVRRGEPGVFIRLVGRKSDKVIRMDPWHVVEWGEGSFKLGVEVWKVLIRRREAGGKDEDGLFVDCEGIGMKGVEAERVWNWVVRRVGVVKLGGEDVLVGKSCRVGGAIAAILGGVPEVVVRVIGGWKSENMLKYIGGLMAAWAGVMAAIEGVGATEVPLPDAFIDGSGGVGATFS